MVLLAMYRVCDYICLMSLVMFPGGGCGDSELPLTNVARSVNINLCVSYLDNISDKQNYGLFKF